MDPARRRLLAASAAAALTGAAPALARPPIPSADAPVRYPDPAWEVLDPAFEDYFVFNTPLQRLWTGGLWLEGPAWNAVGRYVVFSDIPRARQMRWDEVTGQVSVLREGVGHANGNAFDARGRLLACEHSPARVLRYEHDGRTTALERYEGRLLNAPNDLVPLPEGGLIFTDPGYGALGDYEGRERPLQLPPCIYHVDDGLERPVPLTDALVRPNGIALSPDGRTLYATDSAPTDGAGPARIVSWPLSPDRRSVGEMQTLVSVDGDGVFHDGIAVDEDGNIWAGTVGGGEGVDGVTVYTAAGRRIGRIRLPEACANLCFVGADRNRLFMTASQSIYSLYTGARGSL